MSRYSILKYAKALVLALSFSVAILPAHADTGIVAEAGDVKITMFEVSNIMNTKMPLVSYHGSVSDEKKAAVQKEATEEAVNRVLLSAYLKKTKSPLVRQASAEAEKLVKEIRSRFKTEDEFNAQLKQAGITRPVLTQIQERHALRGLFERAVNGEQIPESEMKEYYAKNTSMFLSGESVQVKNCFIAADGRELSKADMEKKKQYATEVMKLLKSGAQGAYARCQQGTYPETDAVFSYSPEYPYAEIVKLKKGEFDGPFQVLRGYLVVQVTGKNPSRVLDFASVKGEIEMIMRKGEFSRRFTSIVKEMRNEIPVRYYRGSTASDR